MTKKYLTSFGPEDVLRMVLQCKKCGAEVSSARRGNLHVPNECHSCYANWNGLEDREDKRTAEHFVNLLWGLSAKPEPVSGEPYKPPWTVRLVIESGPGSSGEDVQEDA